MEQLKNIGIKGENKIMIFLEISNKKEISKIWVYCIITQVIEDKLIFRNKEMMELLNKLWSCTLNRGKYPY